MRCSMPISCSAVAAGSNCSARLRSITRDAIESFKPHVVYTLLEEFHYATTYDQHIASYLELMKVPYTGCNPRCG